MMLQPISDVLRTRVRRSSIRHSESWEHIDECHVEIAKAIAASDGDRAEVLMREHLQELRPLYEDLDNAKT
jgi:DNA-binding GntR family transcriptional regulator